ncbi:MAG TPA: hypothetical protein VHO03_05115 [Ignavibacteriales bacterium]|nr:hypothetical protein [Ignavibacteriales bacterium]
MEDQKKQNKNKLEQMIENLKDSAKTLQEIIEEVKTEDPEAEFPGNGDQAQDKKPE